MNIGCVNLSQDNLWFGKVVTSSTSLWQILNQNKSIVYIHLKQIAVNFLQQSLNSVNHSIASPCYMWVEF